ncbi:MAG: hypothetical protein AAF078_08625 [Planctomycetota bacterium]
MRHRSYLPTTDAGLLAWAGNFAREIGADPAAVGLKAGEAAEYAGRHVAYAAALARATAPETRGGAAVLAKNTLKAELTAASRALARRVGAWRGPTGEGIGDEKRLALGLLVRRALTRVPAPSTRPVLRVVGVQGRRIELTLRDEALTVAQGRPRGVSGATLMYRVGAAASARLEEWCYAGPATRRRVWVTVRGDAQPGAPVWVTGWWENPRGQRGPSAMPVRAWLDGKALWLGSGGLAREMRRSAA